jgi:protein-S-isoprenylcysteine O-methyltransferase Ste14
MVPAIYALSFWHYYLYWLAYRYGAVPLAAFKRDAVVAKTVSLAALSLAYFAAPLDPLSLAAVAAGFLLNITAAAALGSDRTYYGYEVVNLPPQRITAFPYSVVPHPMLLGNIVAFAGTLINPEFRQAWWPLACAHVALNLGLLAMELVVRPRRGAAPRFRLSVTNACYIAAIGAAIGTAAGYGDSMLIGAAMGAGISGLAAVLYRRYSSSEKRAP